MSLGVHFQFSKQARQCSPQPVPDAAAWPWLLRTPPGHRIARGHRLALAIVLMKLTHETILAVRTARVKRVMHIDGVTRRCNILRMKTRKQLRALRAFPVAPEDACALRAALRESAGNVSRAARRLGIARQTAYRRIWALGLEATVRGLR